MQIECAKLVIIFLLAKVFIFISQKKRAACGSKRFRVGERYAYSSRPRRSSVGILLKSGRQAYCLTTGPLLIHLF